MYLALGFAVVIVGAFFGWLWVSICMAAKGMTDHGPEGCDGEGADTR